MTSNPIQAYPHAYLFIFCHEGIYIKHAYIRQIKQWGYIYIHNMNIIMTERVEAIRLTSLLAAQIQSLRKRKKEKFCSCKCT